jgi:hypothetical protein
MGGDSNNLSDNFNEQNIIETNRTWFSNRISVCGPNNYFCNEFTVEDYMVLVLGLKGIRKTNRIFELIIG